LAPSSLLPEGTQERRAIAPQQTRPLASDPPGPHAASTVTLTGSAAGSDAVALRHVDAEDPPPCTLTPAACNRRRLPPQPAGCPLGPPSPPCGPAWGDHRRVQSHPPSSTLRDRRRRDHRAVASCSAHRSVEPELRMNRSPTSGMQAAPVVRAAAWTERRVSVKVSGRRLRRRECQGRCLALGRRRVEFSVRVRLFHARRP
jgi:hypothetical protein